jgi:hypothetical protein
MAALALRSPLSTTALTENQFAPQWEHPAASSAAFTEPREQAYTVSARTSAYRVVVRNNALAANSLPPWVKPTISAFIEIQNLPDNWDSYGGKATNRELIKQSLLILGSIAQADSPAPSVVPMGNGGIQIEWHRRQQDLEIAFPAGEAPQFHYRNRGTGMLDEGSAYETEKLIHLLNGLA